MILNALDLLRTLAWGLISFIYSLIDSLFEILKSLNAFDIINSISNNKIFSNFYSGVFAIAITLLGLFSIWRFVMKLLEPNEGINIGQIVKEIIKCSIFVLCSTFLFVQSSGFSNKLASYTASIFENNNITLSDSMLSMYIDYSKGYKESDGYKNEDISNLIKNDTFSDKKMYNDKYVTSDRWILPNEKDYKYEINWIMIILVGAFFLYSLFFSGMMLARRQIEFLFLFLISPIIFATSIGNKQRRGAVIEQLVSLMLQGVVIMVIITLTTLVLEQVNLTTFFEDSVFKNILIKSLLYIGCGSFLLTGSQVINRFIGSNVSANSGREQIMAMMGFGSALQTGSNIMGSGMLGAGLLGLGTTSGVANKLGGNKVLNKIGSSINKLGNNISNSSSSNSISKIGNAISNFGGKVSNTNLSSVGKNLRKDGLRNIGSAVNQVIPTKNLYRRRFGDRG